MGADDGQIHSGRALAARTNQAAARKSGRSCLGLYLPAAALKIDLKPAVSDRADRRVEVILDHYQGVPEQPTAE
jgi:hypothetical protein